jgi:hypothetical protein
MYRELVQPFHKRAVEWAHSRGIYARLHSCGNIMSLLPDILDTGVDALNPLEVKAGMDAMKIKKELGDKLVLHGGINAVNWSNIDAIMAEIEEKALIYSGTKQYFVVNFPQRPGALREFLTDVLGPDDDIAKFEYTKKISRANGPALVGILLGDYKTLPGLLERLKNFDANYISVSENPTLYEFLV